MKSLEKKFIVGLTGGIGSGKSTIAKMFAEQGIDYIDADDIAREVVAIGSPCLEAIEARYGKHILLNDGTLDRRKLRHIIFEDVTEKTWLESLTHPVINNRLIEHLANSKSLYVLLVHPLLFETQKNQICDYTVAITVAENIQVQRVCSRDNIEEKVANSIIASQMADESRREQADSVIENSGCETDLDAKILTLHQQLSSLAHAKLD